MSASAGARLAAQRSTGEPAHIVARSGRIDGSVGVDIEARDGKVSGDANQTTCVLAAKRRLSPPGSIGTGTPRFARASEEDGYTVAERWFGVPRHAWRAIV